jgi:hypothetical protein
VRFVCEIVVCFDLSLSIYHRIQMRLSRAIMWQLLFLFLFSMRRVVSSRARQEQVFFVLTEKSILGRGSFLFRVRVENPK